MGLALGVGIARVTGSGAIADGPRGADRAASQETALAPQLEHADAVVLRTLRRSLALLAAKEERVRQLPFAAVDKAANGAVGSEPEAIIPLQPSRSCSLGQAARCATKAASSAAGPAAVQLVLRLRVATAAGAAVVDTDRQLLHPSRTRRRRMAALNGPRVSCDDRDKDSD